MAIYANKAAAVEAVEAKLRSLTQSAAHTYYYTKAPTGLAIARSGNTFTCSWKKGDDNYGDGVQVKIWAILYGNKTHVFFNGSAGANAEQKSISIAPLTQWYPYAGKPGIMAICFQVRGNRKQFKKEFSASAKYYTDKKKKKTKTYTAKASPWLNPTWSSWADKTQYLGLPPTPSVTATVSDSDYNITTFAWSSEVDDASFNQFTYTEWQTAFVIDSNETNGAAFFYNGGGTTGASDSTSISESTVILSDGHSYTRWVRARARGVYGDSPWIYAKHVYAQPFQATDVLASAAITPAGGFNGYATFRTWASVSRPIDHISIQYALATPVSGMNCPSGVQWVEAGSSVYHDGVDASSFSIDDTLDPDMCLFVRITTEYNAIYQNNYGKNFGVSVLAYTGTMKPPVINSVTTDATTFKATIQAENKSAVEDSFLAIIYQGTKNPNNRFVVGVIPNGQTQAIVQCPDWTDEEAISFGVYAVAGQYSKQTREDGADSYVITPYTGKPLMTSEQVWEGGEVPLPPRNVKVEGTSVAGSVKVSWDWLWSEATGAELSWSDHSDAWESTDEPDAYQVSNLHAPSWNIAGLTTGKTWYIRVRYIKEAGDTTSYSPWSDLTSDTIIDLSSPPETPKLTLSSPFVIEGDSFTATWAYVSTDGTPQAFAQICEATVTGQSEFGQQIEVEYGDVIAEVTTQQSIELFASDLGWNTGQTYHLCLRTQSASGRWAEKWSDPVAIYCVERIECEIDDTSLENVTIDERTVLSLTEMPLSVSVTGGGDNGVYGLIVERAQAYRSLRPDGNTFIGDEGETVYVGKGSGDFEITTDDILSPFDDDAIYRIIATVNDEYGQSARAELQFEVHWSHQALMPSSEAYVDDDTMCAFITPVMPSGALLTDTCDIYRLNADKPTLIRSGAVWGETYVDPYPAIGERGGHRIVFRTANGDYITEDKRYAWIDVTENEGNVLVLDGVIIDFNGNQMIIDRNIDISNSWKKDFQETKYLGGSIQGDWNAGVQRSTSINTVALDMLDAENIALMRQLSEYAGICHVRTPDGSSFFADIQVSESMSHDTMRHVLEYDLTITRVEAQGEEAVTYDEWVTGTAAQYRYELENDGKVYETADTPSGYTFEINEIGELYVNAPFNANEDISFELDEGRLFVNYE